MFREIYCTCRIGTYTSHKLYIHGTTQKGTQGHLCDGANAKYTTCQGVKHTTSTPAGYRTPKYQASTISRVSVDLGMTAHHELTPFNVCTPHTEEIKTYTSCPILGLGSANRCELPQSCTRTTRTCQGIISVLGISQAASTVHCL